jgi:hypothetical protein
MLRSADSQRICLRVRPMSRFSVLLDSCGFIDVRLLLSEGGRSIVYNCCWASPAKSFSGKNSRYTQRYFVVCFETPPVWRIRFPYLFPRGPVSPPRHWAPFTSLFTTRVATVEVFDPPPHPWVFHLTHCLTFVRQRLHWKHLFVSRNPRIRP